MADIQIQDLVEKNTIDDNDLLHIKDGANAIDYKFTFSNFILPPNNPTRQAVEALGTVATEDVVPISKGGTGATTAGGARTNLGLGNLSTTTASSFGLSWVGLSNAAAGRTSLGLGSLATLSSINNNNWSGTDLSIANGGTGASDAATARANLGLGTAATQNISSAQISNWNTAYGWGNHATAGYALSSSLGSAAYQPDTRYVHRANNLSDLGSASLARSNLGLGTLATLSTINNSNWSGADLAIANGGTGASTAADARSNLGLSNLATTTATSLGINLVTSSSQANARTVLGLGTAATRNVGTSSGNVMEVGAFGLGLRANESLNDLDGLDMNNLPSSVNTAGFHGHTAGNAAANSPSGVATAYLFLKELSGARFQIAMERSSNKYYMRTSSDEWDQLHHTGNISQTTGSSTKFPMSQKAITDALNTKVNQNDSRLSDSREWTASTVSQAEAEAGTATTRRAWTAQRVRQAILAWYNGVSGTIGRTILGRNTASQVRSDLGLGTTNDVTFRDITGRNIDATGYVRGSDISLKENITELSCTKDELDSIGAYLFTWKDNDDVDASLRGVTDSGVLAQELLNVDAFKHCVYLRKNGTYGVDYAKAAFIYSVLARKLAKGE